MERDAHFATIDLMPLEGNNKLSSELEKLLPSSFPEERGQLEVINLVKDFKIETKVSETPAEEVESAHPLYSIFRRKNWKDLAQNSENLLNDNPADAIARLYWISSQLHLKNIPSEIIAGSFLELLNSDNFSDTSIDEHWGVISSIWMMTCEGKNAIRLTPAYEKLSRLIPDRAESLYRNFLESQFVILRDLSRTATAQSEVIKNFEYISALRAGFHRKIQEDRILPLKNSRQSNTVFILLLFLTVLLAVYQFQDNFFSPIDYPDQKAEIQTPAKPQSDKPALPIVEPQSLPETQKSISLDAVLLEIQKDRQSADKQKAAETVDLSAGSKGPQVIDINNPAEPAYITEIIESDSGEDLDAKTERGANIVEGDSPYRPIVTGEVTPGKSKNLYHLKDGDILYVKQSTSLFTGPDEIEAELLSLRSGDRLVVIKDYKEWVRVQFAGRVKGFVKKKYLDVR